MELLQKIMGFFCRHLMVVTGDSLVISPFNKLISGTIAILIPTIILGIVVNIIVDISHKRKLRQSLQVNGGKNGGGIWGKILKGVFYFISTIVIIGLLSWGLDLLDLDLTGKFPTVRIGGEKGLGWVLSNEGITRIREENTEVIYDFPDVPDKLLMEEGKVVALYYPDSRRVLLETDPQVFVQEILNIYLDGCEELQISDLDPRPFPSHQTRFACVNGGLEVLQLAEKYTNDNQKINKLHNLIDYHTNILMREDVVWGKEVVNFPGSFTQESYELHLHNLELNFQLLELKAQTLLEQVRAGQVSRNRFEKIQGDLIEEKAEILSAITKMRSWTPGETDLKSLDSFQTRVEAFDPGSLSYRQSQDLLVWVLVGFGGLGLIFSVLILTGVIRLPRRQR